MGTLLSDQYEDVRTAMQSPSKPKRPVGVIIIAAIAAAGGLLSLFGAASVFSGNATGPTWLATVVVIFGVLGVALGVGFYTGAHRAWIGGIVIYVIYLLGLPASSSWSVCPSPQPSVKASLSSGLDTAFPPCMPTLCRQPR